MKHDVAYTDDKDMAAAIAEAGYFARPLNTMKNYTFAADVRSFGFQSKYASAGGSFEFKFPSLDFIERCLEYIEFLEFDLNVPMRLEIDGAPAVKNISRQSHPAIEGDRFQEWELTESTSGNTYKARIHLRDYNKIRKSLRLAGEATKTRKGHWLISWGSVLYSASYLDCLLYQAGQFLENQGYRASRRFTLVNDTARIKLIHKMLAEVFRYKYDAELPCNWQELKFDLENDWRRGDSHRIGFRRELNRSERATTDSLKAWGLDLERMAPFNVRVWVPTFRAFLNRRLYSVGDGY